MLEWFDPFFPGGHWTPQLVSLAGATHPLNAPRWVTNAGPAATGMAGWRLWRV